MERYFKHRMVQELAIDPGRTLLLGFSGGPDSLCLLHLLVENGFHVTAAHLDHGLRDSSADEAAHAQEVCNALGVECVMHRVDVTAHARQHHLSVEESARVMRYEFLFEEALRLEAQAVLVAHNADDQTETVLMHLMRGSGLSGLAGMRAVLLPNPWSDRIPLVRPLIEISRTEIESFLVERRLEAVLDASNTDQQYFRNRIRHELIPYLESYNPQLRERILRLANVAAIEDDFLRATTDGVWRKAVKLQGDHFLVIDRAILQDLHTALLRRFMRRAIEWMDPDLRDIDYDVINRAAVFCLSPTRSRRIDLLAGIELFLYRREMVVARVDDPLHGFWPQYLLADEIELPVPGRLQISPGWEIRSNVQKSHDIESSSYSAYLDAKKMKGRFVISRSRLGDRFAPYGLDGHTKKMGDFWNSVGLPARARDNWPILRAGGEIVWIPGFRIAHHARVDETTTEVIHIVLEKNDSK
jgi:tRNA(Ile)-lysidine synthase